MTLHPKFSRLRPLPKKFRLRLVLESAPHGRVGQIVAAFGLYVPSPAEACRFRRDQIAHRDPD
jgi:hypothetical protein